MNYTKFMYSKLYKSIFSITKFKSKPPCPHTSKIVDLLLGVFFWLLSKLQL